MSRSLLAGFSAASSASDFRNDRRRVERRRVAGALGNEVAARHAHECQFSLKRVGDCEQPDERENGCGDDAQLPELT